MGFPSFNVTLHGNIETVQKVEYRVEYAMKITSHAAPWLLNIAKNLVKSGAENPGVTNFTWLQTWNVSLRWVQAPTFCAMAYYGEGNFDENMKMQIIDAFSRSCKKKLVTIANETSVSGICFFGGAPLNVDLATLDIEAMKIDRRLLT